MRNRRRSVRRKFWGKLILKALFWFADRLIGEIPVVGPLVKVVAFVT